MASLASAASVIPAPKAYIDVVVVRKLEIGVLQAGTCLWTQ